MTKLVLSLGSNCGDREKSLKKALKWLETIAEIEAVSSIYETPCAKTEGRNYMNAVVIAGFNGGPGELDPLLKEYEGKAGRDKECRERGEVPVDIDIVIADGVVVKEWDFNQRFFRIGFEEVS